MQSGLRLVEKNRRRRIIRILDPSRLRVRLSVVESDRLRLRVGEEATVKCQAVPGVVMQGRVAMVGTYPLPTTLSVPAPKRYEATVNLDDPPPSVKIGLPATVEINVAR